MSNNKKIELLRSQIQELEIKAKNETDLELKSEYMNQELILRTQYTPLLLKKRPMLLTLGIIFAIFYGISLMICLPPFIIRGKKRDINEEKIRKLNVELEVIAKQIKDQEKKEKQKKEKTENELMAEEIDMLKKELATIKKASSKTKSTAKKTTTKKTEK